MEGAVVLVLVVFVAVVDTQAPALSFLNPFLHYVHPALSWVVHLSQLAIQLYVQVNVEIILSYTAPPKSLEGHSLHVTFAPEAEHDVQPAGHYTKVTVLFVVVLTYEALGV